MKIQFLFITIAMILLAACAASPSRDFVIASSVQQDSLPVFVSSLPSKGDYIIYVKQDVAANEVWAISPESGEKAQVAKGNGLFPGNWSPSGNHWLFVDYYSLYVSRADGSDIRRVYEVQDKSYIAAWWLTDEVVLFDLYVYDDYDRIWPPPHQYYINIKNGKTGRLDPKREDDRGGTYLVQGIIPSSESWIQVNAFTGEVEIADLEGKHTKILSRYILRYPVGSLGIAFVPKTDKAIFLSPGKDVSHSNKASDSLWEMSLAENEPKRIVAETIDMVLYEFHISPDGRYLAYTYRKGQRDSISLFDLQEHKLVNSWDYPYNLSTPTFLWSPDSRYVALPYVTPDHQTIFGIQTMDIPTGEFKVIIDEDVTIAAFH